MIIVLGGSGYIGSAIVHELKCRDYEVVVLSRSDCDYYQREKLHAAIKDSSFLVNAAGFTGRPNVDACEFRKSDCLLGNAVLPGIVREVCESLQLPWIHVSSGCIFNGVRQDGSSFTEDDTPNFTFRNDNCSFYSGTKALGEEVLKDAVNCYVLRLRIPFESVDNPRNYLSKLITYERLLDATNSLTSLDEFAACCLHCIGERPMAGIYNVVNSGAVTTRDVVARINSYGISQKEFQYFDSEEHFMKLAAKTPRSNCILDNRKSLDAGFPLSRIEDALDLSLSNWKSERRM